MSKLFFLSFLLIPINALAANKVKGGLDPTAINLRIKKEGTRFRDCYNQALKLPAPPSTGRVEVLLKIDALGAATAKIASSTLNHAGVEKCLLDIFNELTFPQPEGGGTVDVTYPLNFSPPAKTK